MSESVTRAGSALPGGDDVDRADHDGLDRAVARGGRNGRDRVDDGTRSIVGDLAEDRVLAVEPRRRIGRDEELRAVGALGLARDGVAAQARVGHRQQVGGVEVSSGWISSLKL
jgi:hypothetical protein